MLRDIKQSLSSKTAAPAFCTCSSEVGPAAFPEQVQPGSANLFSPPGLPGPSAGERSTREGEEARWSWNARTALFIHGVRVKPAVSPGD